MRAAAVVALLACACAPFHAPHRVPERLTVRLQHGSADERATAEQLDHLFRQHDLAKWFYTLEVVIDRDAIPHSHPSLTLHTRHLRDPLLLLSTFIHEQSHWYLAEHQAEVDRAVAELRALAPGLPVGFPDGAMSETSSYEHLIVIALEERALIHLVGELAAREAMQFWANDHYRALYRLVLERRDDVWRVMRAHGLASPV